MANNKNKENTSIKSGMPETMFSETTAQKVRWAMNDAISDLHYAVLDLREAGVPIESVKDMEGITREGIIKQLEKDREAYFKNMRFVPAGIRRQVNQEFADMKATLLPLADQLVRARKRVPLTYTLNVKDKYATTRGEYCIECNEKELEDYVRKAATTTILPEYREYYEALSAFCDSWKKLCEEAQRLHIVKPGKDFFSNISDNAGNVLKKTDDLSELRKHIDFDINMTPEKMFHLISLGVVRMQTAEELALSEKD